MRILLKKVYYRFKGFLGLFAWVIYQRYRLGARVNLGSGIDYRIGYVNVDRSVSFRLDININMLKFMRLSRPNTFQEIISSHVVNYLNYWELEELFALVYNRLNTEGVWVIENPDLDLIIKNFEGTPALSDSYFENVRALFAFDMQQVKRRENYFPYRMAYRSSDLVALAERHGFNARVKNPEIHCASYLRDFRLELRK